MNIVLYHLFAVKVNEKQRIYPAFRKNREALVPAVFKELSRSATAGRLELKRL
jgi:hypothetical protein